MLNTTLNVVHSELFHSSNDFLLNAYHLLDKVLGSCNRTVKKTAKPFPSWNEYSTESSNSKRLNTETLKISGLSRLSHCIRAVLQMLSQM